MEKEIKPEQLVGTDTEPRQTGGGGDKTKKTTKSPFLVIFDFDWSLINENSDIWILRQLIPEQENDLRKIMKTVHFTDAMHEGMRRVHEAGISKERLIETLRKIPFFASMREAVFAMKEKGHRIYILSDANTEFIDAILSGYPGLKDCFVKVYSNIGHFDDNGRLHIKYYHQSSHGCSSPCPKNLCKGVVLDEILEKEGMRRRSGARREEKSYGGGGERRVVYIGDGGNDVCPAMRLDSIDYVFARSGFRLSKALTKSKPAAKVLMWSNGDEAKAHFDSVVLGAPDVHTSKPQQQQQQGSRKEEQQRMSSECTRASSIVRTLQARVKDYSFLVCGIHPSLLKFIRGTLSSSSSSSSPSMQSTKGGEDGSGREGKREEQGMASILHGVKAALKAANVMTDDGERRRRRRTRKGRRKKMKGENDGLGDSHDDSGDDSGGGGGGHSPSGEVTVGITLGTIHADRIVLAKGDEDVIVCFILDPLDIDSKQITFMNRKTMKLGAQKANVVLYKWVLKE